MIPAMVGLISVVVLGIVIISALLTDIRDAILGLRRGDKDAEKDDHFRPTANMV